MSLQIREHRADRGWWISFAVLLSVSLVFALIVGARVATVNDPVELGHSTTGEWAELSEFGFRARLDDMSIAESFPSAYEETLDKAAPEGMALLRVRFSIEPLVADDGLVACLLSLFNGKGDRLTRIEYGVAGPESAECSLISTDGERQEGVPYATQTVWVVAPDPVESFSLQLVPLSGADDNVYWTFSG